MFTRVVHIHAKTGKGRELSNHVHDKILPILKKQPGFVDEITLVSSTEPDRLLALSFWENEEQAQRYQREQFPKINEILQPLAETAPRIETYHVDISTTHKISKGKAA